MNCENISVAGLPWVGGKKSKYKYYREHFPKEIDTLVDLFAGGGTISFSTPAREIITNDIDQNLINLYTVLKSEKNWEKILDYEKSEAKCRNAHDIIRRYCVYLDNITRAKYTVADIFMSFNKGRGSYRKALDNESQEKYHARVKKCLGDIQKQLQKKNIHFECKDALELLREYIDREDVFIFADPPYINSTINNHVYYEEMLLDGNQEMLAYLLANCKGKVMLCGYRDESSEVYDRHFRKNGDYCYELKETYATCEKTMKGEKKGKRIEYIWTNYKIDTLKEVDIHNFENFAA